MVRQLISEPEAIRFCERHGNGESIDDIARDIGLHRRTVLRALKRIDCEHVQTREQPEDSSRYYFIYHDHEKGMTAAEIGRKYSVSRATVYRSIAKYRKLVNGHSVESAGRESSGEPAEVCSQSDN